MDMEKVMENMNIAKAVLCNPNMVTPEMCIMIGQTISDAISMLKEQEAVEPNTIPEELKQKMWNALYAEEDKLEKKYAGTKEHNSWFLIYRPWLQGGFDIAIKAIADWEGR